jgi:Subtilase family.
MKKESKIIRIGLALTMVSFLLAANASAYYEEASVIYRECDKLLETKLSKTLIDKVNEANDDDLIPIYIFRKPDAIGYLANHELVSDWETEENVDEGSTKKEIEDAQELLSDWRKEVRNAFTSSNKEFAEKYIPTDRKIFYYSKYTPTFAVEATPEEIRKYAELEEVTDMDYFEDYLQENETNIVIPQINVDDISGSSYNSGDGYTGDGIIVGVIEASSGQYDISAPHLNGVSSNNLCYLTNTDSDGNDITPVITDHATKVVSLILGQSVTISSNIYRGVAQNATVYQTSAGTSSDTCRAFELLVDNDVNIINYSGGSLSTGYNSYDRQIDYLIQNTMTPFIKSAGNTSGEITSPGKALNAITVGNAATKTDATTSASSPFSMYSTSAYTELSYIPNKPDLCAPGAHIRTVKTQNPNSFSTGSGTSYAAPIITGVLAQAMEKSSYLIGNPFKAKAYITNCADYTSISSSSNSNVGNYLREKSGAGLIDALKIANGGGSKSGTITANNVTKTSQANTYTKGQKIKATLTFSRSSYSDDNEKTGAISSLSDLDDIDFYLVDSNNNIVASSTSSRNNVEIIEYTVQEAGTYYYKCTSVAIKDTTHGVEYAMAWKVTAA